MKQMRRDWFADWLIENREFKQEEIVKFHNNDKLGTSETSVKMFRPNVETVSITSVKKVDSNVKMDYIDFVNIANTKQKILEEQ